MLEALSDKLGRIFKSLRVRGSLTEQDVGTALREVRLALLEADIHYDLVRGFIDRIRAQAVGQQVLESLTPGQQVIKIVRDELTALMGGADESIRFASEPPTVLMLLGLQGVGKTTTAAKLAQRFHESGKKVLLVAADTKRPAAVEQLRVLGRQIPVDVLAPDPGDDPIRVCERGRDEAVRRGYHVVVFDTAGRLQIDEALMAELVGIRDRTAPHEVLLVADSMTGQAAVSIAEKFHQSVGFDGIIMTKTEGDARGGALLSMHAVTGKPVKFVGTGEGLGALEPFYPDRMASRILGMGDVLSLIERAQSAIPEDGVEALQRVARSGEMNLEDLRDQIRQVRKMGSLSDILGLLPGLSAIKTRLKADDAGPERELKGMTAILDSMTPRERQRPQIINGSRRLRIARGSGTSIQQVNRLLKQFKQMQKMMKTFGRGANRHRLADLLLRG